MKIFRHVHPSQGSREPQLRALTLAINPSTNAFNSKLSSFNASTNAFNSKLSSFNASTNAVKLKLSPYVVESYFLPLNRLYKVLSFSEPVFVKPACPPPTLHHDRPVRYESDTPYIEYHSDHSSLVLKNIIYIRALFCTVPGSCGVTANTSFSEPSLM